MQSKLLSQNIIHITRNPFNAFELTTTTSTKFLCNSSSNGRYTYIAVWTFHEHRPTIAQSCHQQMANYKHALNCTKLPANIAQSNYFLVRIKTQIQTGKLNRTKTQLGCQKKKHLFNIATSKCAQYQRYDTVSRGIFIINFKNPSVTHTHTHTQKLKFV